MECDTMIHSKVLTVKTITCRSIITSGCFLHFSDIFLIAITIKKEFDKRIM